MSKMSKLNIKTFKLPSTIIHLFTLSFGYSFGFYSNNIIIVIGAQLFTLN